MRKLLLMLVLLLACTPALAETAAEYCAYLEEVLPEGDFSDSAVPDFCIEKLGGDYELHARSSARYGNYIAAVRKTPCRAPPTGAT